VAAQGCYRRRVQALNTIFGPKLESDTGIIAHRFDGTPDRKELLGCGYYLFLTEKAGWKLGPLQNRFH
jgi:hypothetical protein